LKKQRYVLMCDITRNAGLVESKRTSVEKSHDIVIRH